jgi:hypothetical protein
MHSCPAPVKNVRHAPKCAGWLQAPWIRTMGGLSAMERAPRGIMAGSVLASDATTLRSRLAGRYPDVILRVETGLRAFACADGQDTLWRATHVAREAP